MWAWPVACQHLQVVLCGVTFVAIEAVDRKLGMQIAHNSVPMDLGEYARRRNSGLKLVTLDDGSSFALHLWSLAAIEQRQCR